MIRVPFDRYQSLSYPVGEDMGSAFEFAKAAALKLQPIIASKNLRKLNIICRGSSGAILAALLSSQLVNVINCQIIHIKKPGESSHSLTVPSFSWVEAVNVIIDDFISSGETIRAIYEAVHNSTGVRIPIDTLIIRGGYKDSLGFEPEFLISNA